MDWGLSIVVAESEAFAYYWREQKAACAVFSPDKDFLKKLEGGLAQIAGEMGLEGVRQLFSGQGLVRLSTSYLLDLIRHGKGQKIGAILNEHALKGLKEEEKKYLPLFGDNVVFISASTAGNGEIEHQLEMDEVIAAYRNLLKLGVHSVAVGLKNSWLFPAHERQIREILTTNYPSRYLGGVPTYISSDFELDYGNNGLKTLTMLNTYAQSTMRKYCFDLEQKLKSWGYRGGLFLANRYGGLGRWDKTRAIDTAESVFRSNLEGAKILAGRIGIQNAVCLSVDAYSTSLGMIRDKDICVAPRGKVLGASINAPSAELMNIPIGVQSRIAVSSGGIAFDNDARTGMKLEDADRILGYQEAEADENLIAQFKDAVSGPLQKGVEEAALAVRRAFVLLVAEQTLACLSEKGMEASQCALLPANGNAAAYCWDVGKALKVKEVRAFSCGGCLGAFGLGSMALRHFYQTSANIPLDSDFRVQDVEGLSTLVQVGLSALNRDFISEGVTGRPLVSLELVLRFSGGPPERFSSPLDNSDKASIEALCELFAKDLQDRFKDKAGQGKAVLMGFTLLASVPLEDSLEFPVMPEIRKVPEKTKKTAFWEGKGPLETTACRLSTAKPGETIGGPAIVEGGYSAHLVPPGAELRITEDLNGILEVK